MQENNDKETGNGDEIFRLADYAAEVAPTEPETQSAKKKPARRPTTKRNIAPEVAPVSTEPENSSLDIALGASSETPSLTFSTPVIETPEQPEISAADDSVAMVGNANLGEAGRTLLRQQLEKLRAAEPVAREGSDPEGVHAMRVATRRLRAMLKVLEETVYDPKVTADFRRKLRGLANALGETRDNDVFLANLDKYEAELSEEERAGLQPLRAAITERRNEARLRMLKVLDNPKTAKLLKKLEKFVKREGVGVQKNRAETYEVAPNLVRHFAGSAILRRYEEVLAYESAINSQTPIEVLHRLRVAGKRLRYTLEFFQEALPTNVKGLHKQLTNIQDDLGELHDRQVAIELCKDLLSEYPEDVALHLYQSRCAADIVRLREKFSEKWQVLSGPLYREELLGAIAQL